ncbi:MAG: hypothetical protein Athens101426_254 [Parcubacteria group bacterium Athens1014_26]|nr:MAG: hypothetical protein Athens101426_254 [Parcubacteria group bacterium Athens1014_26]
MPLKKENIFTLTRLNNNFIEKSRESKIGKQNKNFGRKIKIKIKSIFKKSLTIN